MQQNEKYERLQWSVLYIDSTSDATMANPALSENVAGLFNIPRLEIFSQTYRPKIEQSWHEARQVRSGESYTDIE